MIADVLLAFSFQPFLCIKRKHENEKKIIIKERMEKEKIVIVKGTKSKK